MRIFICHKRKRSSGVLKIAGVVSKRSPDWASRPSVLKNYYMKIFESKNFYYYYVFLFLYSFLSNSFIQVQLLRTDIIWIYTLIVAWGWHLWLSCIGLNRNLNFLISQGIGDNFLFIIFQSHTNRAYVSWRYERRKINRKHFKIWCWDFSRGTPERLK